MSKHLYFEEHEPKPRTKVWGVYSKHTDELLGEVKYHAPWRQYCFDDGFIVMAKSCLDDLSEFIGIHKNDRVSHSQEEPITMDGKKDE